MAFRMLLATNSRRPVLKRNGIALCLSAVCTSAAVHPAIAQRATVIENVTVIPMTESGAVVRGATVVIANGRIVSINGPAPAGATRINGTGKWLIPGLADMHVHLPSDGSPGPKAYPTEPATFFFRTQDVMTPFIANGVTQLLNLDAVPASVGQRNQIASGEVLGPHIALAAVIDNSASTTAFVAKTPAAVRDIKSQGYDFVKVYSGLSVETFLAVVDEAKRIGLKTLGHIPEAFEGSTERAFVPNYTMVVHAEEFAKQATRKTDEEAAQFAQMARRNNTWVSPTLTVMKWIASELRSLDEMRAQPAFKYVHPMLQDKWITRNRYNRNSTPAFIARIDSTVQFNTRLVRAFKAAGVPLLAGTDCLTSGVICGFSLHDELALLVEAGLTPKEALESATRLPAQWLGTDVDRGTIEVGKRADLVLLNADPLADIGNARKIAGVFVNGRFTPRATLDAMLADLARRNATGKP
jgi:imidazolonepropionase-like amidohydrolase